MASLLIASWAEADAPHGTLIHIVGVLLMCLHVRAELDDGMF